MWQTFFKRLLYHFVIKTTLDNNNGNADRDRIEENS